MPAGPIEVEELKTLVGLSMIELSRSVSVNSRRGPIILPRMKVTGTLVDPSQRKSRCYGCRSPSPGATLKCRSRRSEDDKGLGPRVIPLIRIAFVLEYLGQFSRQCSLGADRWRLVVANRGLPGRIDMPGQGEAVEVAVGRMLRERGLTLAIAESCTGGLLGYRITSVPGSSEYYRGSIVAYASDVKERVLGVPHEVLVDHGAVSEMTARQMARGVRDLIGADVAVAVTGIAGPGGGTAEKPVGLVHIVLVVPEGEFVERYTWEGDRQKNRTRTAGAALDLVWRYLEDDL